MCIYFSVVVKVFKFFFILDFYGRKFMIFILIDMYVFGIVVISVKGVGFIGFYLFIIVSVMFLLFF